MQELASWDFWRVVFGVALGQLMAVLALASAWSMRRSGQANPFMVVADSRWLYLQWAALAVVATLLAMLAAVWALGG